MIWQIDSNGKFENTKIIYETKTEKFLTFHKFIIYDLKKVLNMLESIGFKKVKIFENYSIKNLASGKSKNIQFIAIR